MKNIKERSTVNDCGFKLDQETKSGKAVCTMIKECHICGYCVKHCLIHFQMRDCYSGKVRTIWSDLK